MNRVDTALLDLTRAGLHGEKASDPNLTPAEWNALLRKADFHKLLPLVLDAAVALPSLRRADIRAVGDGSPIPPHPPVILNEVKNPSPVPPSPRHSEHSDTRRACLVQESVSPSAPPQPVSAGQPDPRPPHPPVILNEVKNPSPVPSQPAAASDGPDLHALREEVMGQVARQAIQENEFLNLLLDLRQRGLEPLVVKGCLCRSLYPNPLLRPSVDDDLLIPPDRAPAFHAALVDLNLKPDDPDLDPAAAWELSYHRPESPLYIELHKALFAPEDPAFAGFNTLFADVFDAPVTARIQDVDLLAPAPTPHLLFLILHAYKHFLHSGFGVRIVADVCLFSQAHAAEIDFSRLAEICDGLRCGKFTAALYRIGEKYLAIPAPEAFSDPDVDETALLADILDAGIHGQNIDRLHSANITLKTVGDDRMGKRQGSGGLRKSLFPSAASLAGKYPFLERHPLLLPAAWTMRLFRYLRDRAASDHHIHPTASLRIGRERVALLKEYDIIDK